MKITFWSFQVMETELWYPFGFKLICRLRFVICVFLFFFFFFFVQSTIVDKSTVNSAPVHYSRVPQIILFSHFFIKNESHSTIYTFKIISLQCFQFQFSVSAKISCIQTDLWYHFHNFNQTNGTHFYILSTSIKIHYSSTALSSLLRSSAFILVQTQITFASFIAFLCFSHLKNLTSFLFSSFFLLFTTRSSLTLQISKLLYKIPLVDTQATTSHYHEPPWDGSHSRAPLCLKFLHSSLTHRHHSPVVGRKFIPL